MSPGEPGSERFYKALIRQVTRSRRRVTIMFTDVEGSTSYWERHGDVKGRLMIDLHNRLITPVIKKFGGKVVKHVGDAIMASFSSPDAALRAAVGIQQRLERQRERDVKSVPEVRIGIHTGKAVVEKQDVFGDMVNVASRVGDHAIGGGICVSGSAAAKVKKKAYSLRKKGAFTPRGRRQNIQLYECRWQDCPSFIEDLDDEHLPLVRRQKIELVAYAVAGLSTVFMLAHFYLRPLMVEYRWLALLCLRLSRWYLSVPLLLTLVAAIGLGLAALRRPTSHLLYRLLKGGFGFTVAFLLIFLPARLLPLSLGPRWDGVFVESHGNFVEVLVDEAGLFDQRGDGARVVGTVRGGDILVVDEFGSDSGSTWYRVALPGGRSAWLPGSIPPQMGVPERQVATVFRFELRHKELYALLAGLVGLLWGFLTFRIRPA